MARRNKLDFDDPTTVIGIIFLIAIVVVPIGVGIRDGAFSLTGYVTYSCVDTDGGKDTVYKGICKDRFGGHVDSSCTNGIVREEWYCESSNTSCNTLSMACAQNFWNR